MNILYTSNENYVRHLAASICSLCENNKEAENISFYIISCGILDKSKNLLKNLIEKYDRTVCFYEFGNVRDKFAAKVDTKGFDVSVLSRLFLASCLPEDVDKVIYLDCDTIIIDSILPFFNTELGDNLLAGVPEPVVTKSRRPAIGMQPSDDYYNSGVLLFNLKLWRNEDCESKVISFFVDNQDSIVASDQDAINGCFRNRIKTVAPKYNFASYNIYYNYRLLKKLAGESKYVTKEVYDDSLKNPAIIHYLGEERPWRKGNTHPYSNEYKKYLNMTFCKGALDEEGWGLYFLCFRLFNFFTKPFPALRYKIIDSLIPAFMRYRAKQLNKPTR